MTDYTLSAGSGSYIMTGFPATCRRTMSAYAGTYVMTGYSADLIFSDNIANKVLLAEPGHFTMTGYGVDFSRGINFSVDPGSYTIEDGAPKINRDCILSAEVGSFVITGYPISSTNVKVEELSGIEVKRQRSWFRAPFPPFP